MDIQSLYKTTVKYLGQNWPVIVIITILGCVWVGQRYMRDNNPPTGPGRLPEPVILTGAQGQYPLGLHLEILADPTAQLTIDQVSSPEYAAKFIPSRVATPNYGYTDTAYWVRLRVLNRTSDAGPWLLESGYPNMRHVDLYLPNSAGTRFTEKKGGNALPFTVWETRYHHPVFRLWLSPGLEQTLYLRFENESTMTIIPTLWAPEEFWRAGMRRLFGWGVYFGGLGLLLLYNLGVLLSLRNKSYLYYVLFLASTILTTATSIGMAYQYLWPTWVAWNQVSIVFAFGLYIIFALLLTRTFLRTDIHLPYWDRLIIILLLATGLLVIVTPWAKYSLIIRPLVYLGLAMNLLVLMVSWVSWRQGYRPARFLLLAWLWLAITNIIYLLVRLGLLPSYPLLETINIYADLLLASLLSLTLVDRINLLRQERQEALAQLQTLNEQLEAQVYARTAELSTAQNRYQLATQAAGVGVWDWNLQTGEFYIDPNLKHLLGYTDEEIPNDLEVWNSYVHADDRQAGMATAQAYLDGQTPGYVFERRMRHKDGSARWILTRGVAIRDEQGQAIRLVGTDMDITRRKQVEKTLQESVARFRRLFDQSPVGVAMTALDCHFLRVNETLCRITGYSEAELLTRRSTDITHPDDLAHSLNFMRLLAAGQIEQYTLDKRYIRKDGSVAWVNVSTRAVRDDAGQPQYFLPVVVDISKRKQTEEALRLSEARLHTLFEHIPFPVWMRDHERRVVLQNPIDLRLWGNLSGKLARESNLPPDVVTYWESQQARVMAGEVIHEESRYLLEGEARFFEDVMAPVWVGGQVTGLVGIQIDITERKRQAEDKLRESEVRYRAIVEDQTELICRSTSEGSLTFVNKAYARYFGKEPEELIGLSFYHLIPEEDRPFAKSAIVGYTVDSPISTYEHRVIDGKGEIRWQQWTDRAFFDDQGGLVEFQSVGRDITQRKQMEDELRQHRDNLEMLVTERTLELAAVNRQLEQELGERKQAEAALRLNEARLQALVDNIPFSVWMRDRQGQMILQNPVDVQWWGEMTETLTQEAALPAEVVSEWLDQERRALAGEIVREEVQRCVEDQERHYEEIVAPVWVGDQVTGTAGVQIDITERKQAEALLRESEARFRRLFDQSPVGAAIITMDYQYLQVNEALCRITGYSQAEFLTRTFIDITHPDDLDFDLELTQQLAAGKIEQYTLDKRYIRKDGSIVWINLSARVIRDTAGQPLYFLPIIVDITDRKQAEEALRQAQIRTQAILDNVQQAFFLIDVNARILLANPLAHYYVELLIERPLQEGKSIFSFIPVQNRTGFRRRLTEALAGKSLRFDYTLTAPNNELYWFDFIFAPVFDHSGKVWAVAISGLNINARKHAESALTLSEARLRTLVDHIPFSVWMRDENERMVLQNQVDIAWWGNVVGTETLEANQPPELLSLWVSQNRRAYGGEVIRSENRYNVEGKERIFEEIVAPVWSGHKVSGLVGVQVDITERKQVEAALRRRVEELAIFNQISRTAATVTDLQTIPQVVAEFITALLNAFSTTVLVFDQKQQECQIVARHTMTPSHAGNTVGQLLPMDLNPILGQLIESKHSVLIIEPQTNALISPQIRQTLEKDEIYCLLLTPLLVRAEVAGYISIARKGSSNVFTSDEIKLAETVAFQVTGAIETARLFNWEQQQRQLAEQRHLVAESLGDILAVLNSNQPLAQILAFIADQANRLLDSDATAIYTQLDADEPATLLTAQGMSIPKSAWPALSREQAALRQAAATQRPVVVSNLNGNSATLTELDQPALPYQTMLAVPLLLKGQVYGDLILYFTQPHVFSEETLGLAVTFGHQVALALENTHLRDQVKEVAVAEERNRIARELHDAVTQTLFSASLIAAALPHQWAHNSGDIQLSLDKLRLLTRGALAEMRTMLLELRPKTLVESKLSTLFNYLADALTSRTRIPVKVTFSGDGILPPEVQIAVYRIVQEALNNIGKHSKANQVTLDLHFNVNGIMLRIGDDGCGFEPAASFPGHLGIGIMHERAAAVGAELKLSSQPGNGTQVTLRWPAS